MYIPREHNLFINMALGGKLNGDQVKMCNSELEKHPGRYSSMGDVIVALGIYDLDDMNVIRDNYAVKKAMKKDDQRALDRYYKYGTG